MGTCRHRGGGGLSCWTEQPGELIWSGFRLVLLLGTASGAVASTGAFVVRSELCGGLDGWGKRARGRGFCSGAHAALLRLGHTVLARCLVPD
jgi:hypothetical protein